MDTDEQTPLLRYEPPNRYRRAAAKLCSVQSWKKRVPITIWLPNYKLEYLFRDMIAGITVGLTSIPQGIAYALVAGLPPQVGLYSSIFPGVVYAIFGSCKDVTVGPTAILAALLTKYVAQSADFAYLAAFLSGCIILLLGVLQLGFLLDFISKPVISGFTTAAALQISASQLKSLFRVQGSSGSNVIEALINFFKNIKTIHLWDSILGVTTIVVLLLLKRISVPVSPLSSAVRVCASRACVYVVRARNALVVFGAAILAYCLHAYGYTPFALTGTIQGGLPHFSLPPFSTTVNNRTVNFEGMLSVFGVEGLVMPLVAILESIAIARAFAGSKSVDATQEMLAVGLCNALAACCGCMPATGSFTRTALNHASGVATPAGALFKASLVLLSVTLLSSAFYFIPRSTLAAVIIVAMTSIFDLHTIVKLWRHSRWELSVLLLTVGVGACCGLEYGILGGALADLLRHAAAHHAPNVQLLQIGNTDCSVITFVGTLKYASCARVFRELRRVRTPVVVIDGRYITHIDIGLTESIISAIEELEENGQKCLMWNFSDDQRLLFEDIHSDIATKFVSGPSVDQHILSLEVTR